MQVIQRNQFKIKHLGSGNILFKCGEQRNGDKTLHEAYLQFLRYTFTVYKFIVL